MAITLTERATKVVQKVLEEQKQPEGTMLQVSVVGGGLCGYSYDIRFDNSFDEVLGSKSLQHNVTVVVDKKSALYLDGTTIDYCETVE